MSECTHPIEERIWLVDELGPMRADADGHVSAPVTKSHRECRACGATLPRKKTR